MTGSEENDVYSGTAFILISVIGVAGNAITLFILMKDEDFLASNNSRLSIGNLALVDILFSVYNSFIGMRYLDKKVGSSTLYCNIYVRVLTVQTPLTYLSHALLALHRWQTLNCFRRQRQKRTGFLSRWYSIAVIWMISITIAGILNMKQVMGAITFDHQYGTCSSMSSIMHSILAFVAMICIVIVLVSYIKIYRLVKVQNRQIRDQMESTDATELALKNRVVKITKMLFIIFTVLLVSNVPYMVVASLKEELHINSIWQRITLLIVSANYANNFFLYGLMDRNYRARVKNFIMCKWTDLI